MLRLETHTLHGHYSVNVMLCFHSNPDTSIGNDADSAKIVAGKTVYASSEST